jgi:hypothetical protein
VSDLPSLKCPNCSAPITYAGHGASSTCTFCGTTVAVPQAFRPRAEDQDVPEDVERAHIVEIYQPHGEAAAGRSNPAKWTALLLGGAVMIALLLIALGTNALNVRQALGLETATPQPSATSRPSPTPFARPALAFGKTGSGPGFFSDPRSIAVDSKGRIFIGDYLPGRIQAFSPQGDFLWQALIPGSSDYVRSLAADLTGRIYAAVGRNIEVYEAETGKRLARWEPGPQQIGYYQALAATPGGEIWAVMERELVKYDPQGKVVRQVGGMQEDFLKLLGGNYAASTITGMAVDGTGNIYLSMSGGFVLKLGSNGGLIDRLNGTGNNDSVQAVAVDGSDRLAWAYSDKIMITDTDGKPLGEFKAPSLSDIEFSLTGQLTGLLRAEPQVQIFSFTK